MIAFLRGRVFNKHPNRIIIDVSGVGYEVHVPLSTYYDIGEAGSDVSLHIHTHVREDALQLFGFLTPLEQLLFQRLIGISGIGPKLAVAVLSGIGSRELVTAVQRADIGRLTRIPGVGKKTAERIVLELKEKMGDAPVPISPAGGTQPHLVARDALVELGYSLGEAEMALARVDPELPPEERVREALKAA